MRVLWVSVVAVLLWSLSCGGSPPQSAALSSTWTAPSLLAHVPADSPYVIASIAPVNEAIRRRMLAQLDDHVAPLLTRLQEMSATEHGVLTPWIRAATALAGELRGKAATWWQELGFHPDGRFVLYGLSLWPVLRAEVAQPARLRAVVERVLAAAGAKPRQAVHEGHAYWIAGTAEVSLIAAVMDREAVVAVLPTAAVTAALPQVLGTRGPARTLSETTTVADLLGHYRFMGYLFAYIDMRNLVGIVSGRMASELDGPLHGWTGPVSPVCRAEMERLAAVAPRFVLGYRRLDETGFDGMAVLETAPSVASGLSRVHATAPEVTSRIAGGPLFAIGAALELDALMAWLRGATGELRARPFACPWFTPINQAGASLAETLDRPLPASVRGLHGVSLVVDDATVSPPNVEGHVLIAGDLAADLMSSLSGAVPAIAGVTVKRDGRPVALPVQRLGLPVRSAHVAVSADRLVIAGGADSARVASAHLAAPVPTASPLLVMAVDAPRLQQLLAATGERSDSFGYLGRFGMTIDVIDEGISFDVWGTWPAAAAPAQPTPP